jgi:hypothetical protein
MGGDQIFLPLCQLWEAREVPKVIKRTSNTGFAAQTCYWISNSFQIMANEQKPLKGEAATLYYCGL